MEKIVIFGLGWQGKQFIRYFLKHKYKVFGICKTKKTKINIENQFGINVYNNYKEILNNNIDLLVLSAYPIDIYEEVLNYSLKYDYKILSDLPITFNLNLLKTYINNDKLFLFLIETKVSFFKNILRKNLDNIYSINCMIFQNKNNLRNQRFKIKSVIVDSQYMLNNLLGINYDLLNISYKFKNKEIKNIEYIIDIKFINGKRHLYKYEDGSGINIGLNKYNKVIYKNIDKIILDKILNLYIMDILNNNNKYRKEYYYNFNYLLNKFNYEENN